MTKPVDPLESIESKVTSALSSLRTELPGQSQFSSITSEAGSLLSSYASQLSTATGSDRESLSRAIASLTSSAASRISSASQSATSATSTPNVGPAQTAAVAMGALFGGAAVLANL